MNPEKVLKIFKYVALVSTFGIFRKTQGSKFQNSSQFLAKILTFYLKPLKFHHLVILKASQKKATPTDKYYLRLDNIVALRPTWESYSGRSMFQMLRPL